MGFWSRLTGHSAVPDWAGFFTAAQFQQFNELVLADFSRRNQRASINDGVVTVAGSEEQSGLQNLAQLCNQEPNPSLWPTIIASHFEGLERSLAQTRDMQANLHDFNTVAPCLAVRLYPAEHGQQEDMTDAWVKRTDLEGTITVLVIDLPDAIMTVTRSMAAPWNKTDEELFAVALGWLRRDASTETGAVDMGGIAVKLVAGDTFFVASRALIMEDLEGLCGRHGSLVAVPHRHMLISYPIEGKEVLLAIQKLLPVAINVHRQGPGSISPDIFWYTDRQFVRLPANSSGKNIVFTPPASFQKLLEQLAAE